MNSEKIYAVVMAGGSGTRFWPRSREKSPKQVLEIIGSGSMIANTVARIESLVPPERTLIVTNKLQQQTIRQQLPKVPADNFLIEPVGRNTAPCIALAAQWIHHYDPDAIMIVLPADHIIRNSEEFLRVLHLSIQVAAESKALVTIGIQPTHPETGYGYIQFDDSANNNPYAHDDVYRVKTFAEKPNLETAHRFIESGDFVWNSGMFIWKASAILAEIEQHIPEIYQQFTKLESAIGTKEYQPILDQVYGIIRGVSIDYGVMEKAKTVFVARGDFGWSDVGSWDEVVRLTPADTDGNAFRGAVIAKDATNTYVDAGGRTVGIIGVDDVIVISTNDAVLVCKKNHSQDVKEIVDYLRRKQMNELL